MSPRADPRVGGEVAGYRIEAVLGRGGTAEVYRAVDVRLGRNVALKLLVADLAADERFRERFLQESRLAASLDHPNVIPVYAAGEAEGLLYIAMRYVEGTDLEALVEREGPLEPARALDIVGSVAGALDVAHDRGLVHRDVKPGNVLIAFDPTSDPPEHVYLSDFGLTKQVSTDLRLTQSGQFVGTAKYVAPEQIAGGPIDGRADQYSLGCVLFECLTGAPPFAGDSLMMALWAHVNDAPPSASARRLELREQLDAVFERVLAKRPAERYASCREFIADARRALEQPEAPQARRLRPEPIVPELPGGTVTFLFTDIEGSTRLLKRLGERYAEALADHHRLLGDAFTKHGGQVVDTQGDAFFVAFRRAADAVAAAATVQLALDAHLWPDGAQLRVRMGLHSGEPVVAQGRYVGLAVVRASRICAAARGGQVLLSAATRELLKDALADDLGLRDVGEHELKDFDGPERIFQLDIGRPLEELAVSARAPSEAQAGPGDLELDFRILGPLEVSDRGRTLDLGGPKPRALLAILLVHAGEVVSTDRLIDELWGEAPPKSAHHLLHVYVSRLRKALAHDLTNGSGRLLVSQTPGYSIEIGADALDARRFERRLGEGRRQLAAEDPHRAAETLTEALSLWRGPALSDFTYEPFAQAEIARLGELRSTALEEKVEAELALGRHQELVSELELLAAEHPLRERPRGQLMLALYRCGRQAEALEVYRQTRRLLVDELGIDPGTALQQLQQAILRHDAILEPGAGVVARVEAPGAAPAPATRKLVTVLVAGVADADLLDGLDPEARVGLVTGALEVVAGAVARHGGTVVRSVGEELMGVFGVPAVHEDDALRAVRAAWEAREELLGGASLQLGEMGVAIRAAVETGEAVVEGDIRESVAGEPVARAARLSQRADAGEVVLGEKTYRLVRHAVFAEAEAESGPAGAGGLAGARRLRGLVPEAAVFQRRFDSELVGRDGELAELRQAFEHAVRDRDVQLLTVVGEAGVGKSRLAQELIASLGDTARALVGHCLSYGEGGTFWPLREMVRGAAGDCTSEAILQLLGDDEHGRTIADRVAASIGKSEAVVTREESFWAFRKLFESLARERPLLLVFEDIHWAESTFLELVEYLIDWSRDVSALVLCLARPDLLEERPSWSDDRANTSRLRLVPLDEDESQSLVDNLVAGAALPEEARERIVGAAEGNPLFLEQMLSMLAEEQHALGAVEFPPTIRAVLAARLDRLGPAERAVLERAAVAGREFSQAAVAALLPEDARSFLPRHLKVLLEKQFLQVHRPSVPATERFRFHHTLIQEAAYRAAPKRLRAELHERLADWLEHELGERSGEYAAIVGYHLEQAFRHIEELHAVDWHARRLAERAAERLGTAGRAALAGEDTPLAVNLLDRSVSLRDVGDPGRLELLPDLVLALRETADVDRAGAFVDEAVESAAATGDRGVEARARIERAHLRLMTERNGGVEAALVEGEQSIARFEELGDELGLAKAWQLIALAHRLQGRQSARLEALERALLHAGRAGDLRLEGRIRDHMGGIYNYGPPPVEELLRYGEESLRWARRNGDRVGEADSLAHGLGRSHAMLGDFERAREYIAEARAIFVDLGLVMFVAGHASAAGFVEMQAGDPAAAERELRAGYELVQQAAMRGSYFGMGLRDELAQALYALGRYDEAKALSEESEQQSGSDDLQAQVQWRSVGAKVLARDGRMEEAEALARAAVAIAETTELVLVHANALVDLGEVLRLAGRPDEAMPFVEKACRLFEQKGDRVSAEHTRAAVAELEALSPITILATDEEVTDG